jgi:hydrogenase maturation protein HypF
VPIRSLNIHVKGRVQGVGFRPFVYKIARRNLVDGWVLNSSDGVHIHAQGDSDCIESFLNDLEFDAPNAANIVSIDVEDAPFEPGKGFEIRESEGSQTGRTQVSADLATCQDCLSELFDPKNRRYHYPFINCTNCGPRFTIIEGLPYDRPLTSMGDFEMCPECRAEYSDPSDRRFHAQPDACFECGPSLSLTWNDGTVPDGILPVEGTDDIDERRRRSDAMIASVAQMLEEGKIVAIKGLGGYHLACDARNGEAVQELRNRKHRGGKPLAVMALDVEMAREFCKVNEVERDLLESSAAPIVLLERRAGVSMISRPVAGTLHEIGVMLPYTPLQHLLMRAVRFPLVMTSGNFTEEPIVSSNSEAHERLREVADAFLDNNRRIVSKYDDSVVRVIDGRVQFVRRARGYAPIPVNLPESCGLSPSILATGAQQKATVTLTSGTEAFVSQHIGDLENAESMDFWERTIGLYKKMFKVEPRAIACDTHPEYLSGKWAREMAAAENRDLGEQPEQAEHADGDGHSDGVEQPDQTKHPKAAENTDGNGQPNAAEQPKLKLLEVQHHHAHIAAAIAENAAGSRSIDVLQGVIGVALDGTGFGDDGTIWGGEILLCNCLEYHRMGHLSTFPIIGGEQAIWHPSRLAFGLLREHGLLDHPAAKNLLDHIGNENVTLLCQMADKNLNTVHTSSAGRFLDAISALLGICMDATFDGEAPMLLEAAAYDESTAELADDPDAVEALKRYGVSIAGNPDGTFEIETSSIVKGVLDDMLAGVPESVISRRVHASLCDCIVRGCETTRENTLISTIALSGGVFANRLIFRGVERRLRERGFATITNIALPPNDGCISYGQAAVASTTLSQMKMAKC